MRLIYLLLVSCWLIISSAHGAEPAPGPVSLVDQLQAKIDALDPSQDSRVGALKESYQKTLQYLTLQEEYDSRAQELSRVITDFSQLSQALEKQRQDYRPETIPELKTQPITELEQLLSVNNAKLLNLNNERNQIIYKQTLIVSRRLALPELMGKQRAIHGQLLEQLEQLAATNGSKDDEEVAAKLQLNSHLGAVQSQIKMLDLELISSDSRQSLNKQRIALLDTQIEQLSQLTTLLQDQLAVLRRQETQKTVETSKQLVKVDKTTHPLLQQELETNEQLSILLTQLNAEVEKTTAAKAHMAQLSLDVSNHLKRIKQQLQWLKVSSSFGQALRAELEALPSLPDVEALIDRLGEAQFATYDLEQQIALFSDRDRFIIELTSLASPPLNPGEIGTLNTIINARIPLIHAQLSSYRGLIREMTQQEIAAQNLYTQIQQFSALINRHLLWSPNTGSFNFERLPLLQRNIQWLISPATWQQLSTALIQHPRTPALLGVSIVLLVLWLISRRRLNHLYAQYAPHIGKVTRDKFSHSLHILIAAVFYALPLPIACYLLGKILLNVEGLEFANGTGQGLQWLSWLLWLWLSLKDLGRPDGFFAGHLQWNPNALFQWMKQSRRLVWFSFPLLLLIAVTEEINTEAMLSTLGRGSFVLLCVGISLYFFRTLRESELLDNQQASPHPAMPHQEQKFYNLIWALLVLAPLILGGLALYGYLYTGQKLLTLMLYSVLIAGALIMTYSLAIRGLLIQERRIAFEQAKARRAEMLAQRAKEEAGSETTTDLLDENFIDLKTISDQTRGLTKTLLWIAFGVSLWALWSPQFGALNFLGSITVWETAFTLDGVQQTEPISLKALLLAVAILLLMWISIRSLPGVMQLLVLQHLNLSPGTGYAVTTLLNYLLIVIGFLASFNILGFNWSKLQWLIAALGVGIGFGLQEIVANFISGLIILFEKPIRIGDTVTIKGLTGTVSKIQIRATTIVDWDRKEIIVPNKSFITEQLVNWSLSDPITRVTILVGVAYGSENPLVEKLLLQAAEETTQVLCTPKPEAFFVAFGDSTLNYELRVYVQDMAERLPVTHCLHNLIDDKFREHGVEIAFPQLDLNLKPA